MKASELMALLNDLVEHNGDLDVMVCGLDGFGWCRMRKVEVLPLAETPGSVVAEFEEQTYPCDHIHALCIT